jgi:hypothetical protein
MGAGWCIGALRLKGWAAKRLKAPAGAYSWPVDCAIEVGDVLEVDGSRPEHIKLPHSEDFLVTAHEKVGEYDAGLAQSIVENCQVARKLNELYEGCIVDLGNGKLGVAQGCVPGFSTQFWIPSGKLRLYWDQWPGKPKKAYYSYGKWSIPYVGAETPLDVIPSGALVRLSLSQWFTKNEDSDPACYLQLSGWWLPPDGGTW